MISSTANWIYIADIVLQILLHSLNQFLFRFACGNGATFITMHFFPHLVIFHESSLAPPHHAPGTHKLLVRSLHIFAVISPSCLLDVPSTYRLTIEQVHMVCIPWLLNKQGTSENVCFQFRLDLGKQCCKKAVSNLMFKIAETERMLTTNFFIFLPLWTWAKFVRHKKLYLKYAKMEM